MFTFIRLFSYLQLYDFQIRIKYWMLQAGMRIWAEMPLSAIGLAILSLALHSHLKISGWSSISWIDLEFRQNRENSYKALAPLRTLTGLKTVGLNMLPEETGKCLPWDVLDDPFDWRSWGAKLCIAYVHVSSNCVLFAQTRQWVQSRDGNKKPT